MHFNSYISALACLAAVASAIPCTLSKHLNQATLHSEFCN
jgi:hypothetical protein